MHGGRCLMWPPELGLSVDHVRQGLQFLLTRRQVLNWRTAPDVRSSHSVYRTRPLLCLRPADVEVLYQQAPCASLRHPARGEAAASRARGEELSGELRVADGRGESNTARVDARLAGESLD